MDGIFSLNVKKNIGITFFLQDETAGGHTKKPALIVSAGFFVCL